MIKILGLALVKRAGQPTLSGDFLAIPDSDQNLGWLLLLLLGVVLFNCFPTRNGINAIPAFGISSHGKLHVAWLPAT